jgi:long-chain acyl-CoA synthetase
MLVQEFLEKSAERTPDKVALICGGPDARQRLTYGQIEAQANRLANALKAHGFQRGERVAIHLPNSVEAVVGIFATLKADGVFVAINHSTKCGKLAHILNDCQASALLTSGRQAAMAEQVSAEVPSLKVRLLTPSPDTASSSHGARKQGFFSTASIQQDYSPERPSKVNIDRDLACLIYTSGSSGDAKGVMSDHSNVVFAADAIIEYLENVADDVVINVLPLSFDYGLYQLLMVFRFGGTLVLERGFLYPAAVLQRIVEERVTGLPGVPTFFALLLQVDINRYDLSSLRYLTNTGAALPPAHIAQLREKLPWANLYSMYGLTETKRTLYLPPDQLQARPGSVGIAIPGTEVWLEDEHGRRLGPGQIGELVVRGRHVMRGYWGDPQATAARFRPGVLPGEQVCYTDDLFTMDEDGFLYFLSRKDDIIKSRGEKVAPKEVENVLYGLEGVKEAAVIGPPDPIQGQTIKAFVVPDAGSDGARLSEARVLAHCRANLEDFMVPKYVVICGELPKTPSGKIKKSDLR